ncbi:MAG: hypothetical protein GXX10_11255 [Clostridiaceae bacterium]|nr:hypothetical protein [Clostridiaceae bacterium]
MNIRAYLRDYPFINDEILRLQKELNEIIRHKHESYATLKAVPITDMPKGSGLSDPVYNTVQVIIDRYDHKIEYYTQKINQILDDKALFEQIWFSEILSSEERSVIDYRCFQHFDWKQTAKLMKYSTKQCRRIFNRAIEKLQSEVDNLMKE